MTVADYETVRALYLAKPNLVYSVCGEPQGKRDPLEYAIVGQVYDPERGAYQWKCWRCEKHDCADVQAVQRYRRQAGITE